jgi:hypothetical protein
MAMKSKSNDLEVPPEHLSEKQLRKAAEAALKKADRFWRLVEKAPSENYREHHMKQAKETRFEQKAHKNGIREWSIRQSGEAQ